MSDDARHKPNMNAIEEALISVESATLTLNLVIEDALEQKIPFDAVPGVHRFQFTSDQLKLLMAADRGMFEAMDGLRVAFYGEDRGRP